MARPQPYLPLSSATRPTKARVGDPQWRAFAGRNPSLADKREEIDGVLADYLGQLEVERSAVRLLIVDRRLKRMQTALERLINELEDPGGNPETRDALAWAREQVGMEMIASGRRRARNVARSVAAAISKSEDVGPFGWPDEAGLRARAEQIVSAPLEDSIAHADLTGDAAFEAHLAPIYDFLTAVSRARGRLKTQGGRYFQPGDAWLHAIRRLADLAQHAGIKTSARKDGFGQSPFVALVADFQVLLPKHARRHTSDAGLEHAVRSALRGRN